MSDGTTLATAPLGGAVSVSVHARGIRAALSHHMAGDPGPEDYGYDLTSF